MYLTCITSAILPKRWWFPVSQADAGEARRCHIHMARHEWSCLCPRTSGSATLRIKRTTSANWQERRQSKHRKTTRSGNRAIAQTHQPKNKDYDISRFPLPFEGDRCLVFLIKPDGSTTPLSTWNDLHLLHKHIGSGSWPSPNLRQIYLQESSTQRNWIILISSPTIFQANFPKSQIPPPVAAAPSLPPVAAAPSLQVLRVLLVLHVLQVPRWYHWDLPPPWVHPSHPNPPAFPPPEAMPNEIWPLKNSMEHHGRSIGCMYDH